MERAAVAHERETWTTRRLLRWMTGFFEQKELEAPRVVAEMLLAHVLGCERMRLYMEADRPASPQELTTLRDLTARAGKNEPVHYLVGSAQFHLRDYEVAPCTLIPQPSTETLVEAVLERLGPEPGAVRVLDIGTGSGVIGITLAARLPEATVVATDIADDILALAARNAERHGVADRIEFRCGELFGPVAGETFDVVCSNPPYVPDHQLDAMDAAVREHVPRTAWSGGADGLDVIRPLVAEAPAHLASGALFAMEIDHAHHQDALGLVASPPWRDGELLRDHEGFERVVVARV